MNNWENFDCYEVKKGKTLHLLPSALKEKNFLSQNSELPTTNLNPFSPSFNLGKLPITLSQSLSPLSPIYLLFISFFLFSSPTSSQAGRGGAAPRPRDTSAHRPRAHRGRGSCAGQVWGGRWEESDPDLIHKGEEIHG